MIFAEENFADCLEELKPLHIAHWMETENYRQGLPFNPNYERYKTFAEVGFYRLFTARDNGKVVGNIGMYVTQSMHTQTKIAQEDTLFLLPEARRGFTASKFIRFVESVLVSEGVEEINITIKRTNAMDVLMRRLGYTHAANLFTKITGDAHVRTQSARRA